MSDNNSGNLFVRSESEDDVGLKSPSSLKSFRDSFKRSDSVSSQTSNTSNTLAAVSNRRKNGKFLFE